MKFGEWVQINELHKINYDKDIVYILFEIYFKYFWITILKDKYGFEFYFKLFFINIWLAQNKRLRKQDI